MVHLDYRDARPIYAQIVDGYREQIASAVLRSGEKLPSVRELAGELAINPNTIQRAYRQLEAEGWIATVPGKGCFAMHTCRERDDKRRRALEAQLRELLQELRAMGVSEEEIESMCREGEEE